MTLVNASYAYTSPGCAQSLVHEQGCYFPRLVLHVPLPNQPKGQGQGSTWFSAKAVSPPTGPQYPSGLDKLMAPEWQRQRGRLGSIYLIAHLSLGVLHPLNLMKHSFLSIPFPLPSTKTYHLPSRMFTYSHFVNNFLLCTNCNIMVTKGISLKQMGLYNHMFFCLFVCF